MLSRVRASEQRGTFGPVVGADCAVAPECVDRGRWIRFGAHSNGQYYGMRSVSTGETGWAWDYVLPAPGASAAWTKKSDAEYTIDGPSYPENGRTVTERHDCKKA